MSRVGLKPIQAVDKITVKVGGNQVNVEDNTSFSLQIICELPPAA